MNGRRKATDEELLAAYADTGSVRAAGERFGMLGSSAHERLVKLGAVKPVNAFTEQDAARLRAEYEAAADAGRLADLAADMGRTKQFICRKAKELGLTNARRAKPYLAEDMSARAKAWIAANGHPRGALGMAHSEATKASISEASLRAWAGRTEEERSSLTLRQMKARVAKSGTLAPKKPRGSWKAGWRDVGGRRIYFRSRWEANYARYLEWLRCNGQIAGWEHEPETFWFESIRRGVRSYLPDFLVTETGGSKAYHEVKGWMDSRSKTTIRRFRKYYPQHTLIVVDGPAYSAIQRKASSLVGGWE